MEADFRKQAFIKWLCTPAKSREPNTLTEFGKQMDVPLATLKGWKEDREFLAEWERQFLGTVGSPERRQNILDTLYVTAMDADDPKHVQAAAKYFEIIEGVRPQKVDVTVHRASELTDAQLEEMLAAKAASEKAARLRVVE